jgi:hypothetical protein
MKFAVIPSSVWFKFNLYQLKLGANLTFQSTAVTLCNTLKIEEKLRSSYYVFSSASLNNFWEGGPQN